jgi:hypothetical protein
MKNRNSSQRFGRAWKNLLLALVAISMLASAAKVFADDGSGDPGEDNSDAPQASSSAVPKKVVAPPPTVEKQGSFTRAEDAVVLMGFGADNIAIPPEFAGKLVAQSDLMKVELDFIAKALADKTVPDSDKEMYEARYTLGDPRFDALMTQAHKQGVLKLMLSDSNPVMEGKLDAKVTKVAVLDQSQAKLKEKDSGAEAIQRMLDGGMKLGKDLVLQPFYNAEKVQRVPIMHLKITLIRVGKQKYSIISSMNAAPHQRVNRLMIYREPLMFDDAKAHMESLAEGFRKGKGTNELDAMPWTKYTYPGADASNKALQESLTVRWTDGKYNPNLAIVDTLNTGSLVNWSMSEFAPTSKPVINAIGDAMKKDTNIRGLSITDDKFSTNYGWGVVSLLQNISIFGQFQISHGFGEDVANRVKGLVYQREAVDSTGGMVAQTEEDGVPTNVVLDHEKAFAALSAVSSQNGTYVDLKGQKFKITYKDADDTTGTYTIVDDSGKPVDGKADPLLTSSLFMGSFNLSGNVANTEIQVEHKETSDSWTGKAVRFTFQQLIATQPEYVVPFLEAQLRENLAKAFKIGVNFVPRKLVQQFMTAQRANDTKGMIDAVTEISKIPSTISQPLSQAQKEDNVRKFSDFMNWYETLPPFTNKNLALKRMLGVFLLISDPNTKSGRIAAVLNDAVWRPNMAPDKVNELIKAGNQKLGFPELQLSAPKPATTAPVASGKSTDSTTVAKGKAATPAAAPVAAKDTTSTIKAKTSTRVATKTVPATPVAAKAVPDAAVSNASTVSVFDFDDTIVTLKSKIRIYKIGSKTEFQDVSSSAWTQVKLQLGKPGPYKNFEIRKGTEKAPLSFMYFVKSTVPGKNFLVDAINDGVTEAPEFVAFMKLLADPSLVKQTYILTAREHSDVEWIAGLKLLAARAQQLHKITVPEANIKLFVKNIIGVGYSAAGVPLAKEKEIAKLRTKYKTDKSITTIKFYDDDQSNVDDVAKVPAISSSKIQIDSIHVVNDLLQGKPAAPAAAGALKCSEVFAKAS